jgi:hypothetical protein
MPPACAWLSGRLARDRRRVGDPRPVPALFDPMTSHRWGGILLTEKTGQYRRSVRRAFFIARIACVLIPVGFLITVTLMGRFSTGDAAPLGPEALPAVALDTKAAD